MIEWLKKFFEVKHIERSERRSSPVCYCRKCLEDPEEQAIAAKYNADVIDELRRELHMGPYRRIGSLTVKEFKELMEDLK